MSRTRAQSIVIQGDCVLFGYGKGVYFFIGGGVEEGETAEQAALRELREETNVNGTILFRFKDDVFQNHVTFFVDIGCQVPRLGYDPEETKTGEAKSLVRIELVPLTKSESFTAIDVNYFKLLMAECAKRKMSFLWNDAMNALIQMRRQ
jgi:8-oxo-dGTP pyrophosphatase MutT (NUDIX family)